MQALFSAMSVMVAGSTASMLLPSVLLSVCLSLRVGDGSGKWFMPFYRGGVRSIDKIASNYTVRAGFGIGFSLRCWRFCQLANCFFVFALLSPAPSSPAPFCPTATPTHVPEATAAGGAGTLAGAAWQSFYFVRVWILFSWHSNTYAPPLLPLSPPPLAEGGLGLSLNMQVTSANGAKNPLQQPKQHASRREEGRKEERRQLV